MATSQTTAFTLDIGEITDEAFSRIGISNSKVTTEHIISARRSLNLLQIEWENVMPLNWKIEEFTFTIAAGTATYDVDASVHSIMGCIYRDANSLDFLLKPISRADYFAIHDKALTGNLPNQFFFDRTAHQIKLYPVPTNTNETLKILAGVVADDASKARYNIDAPRHYFEAACSGLAYKLAEKYAPARLTEKKQLYDTALLIASRRDDEDAPLSFSVDMGAIWV